MDVQRCLRVPQSVCWHHWAVTPLSNPPQFNTIATRNTTHISSHYNQAPAAASGSGKAPVKFSRLASLSQAATRPLHRAQQSTCSSSSSTPLSRPPQAVSTRVGPTIITAPPQQPQPPPTHGQPLPSTDHPVLELLRQRMLDGSRPGGRRDGCKLGLVVEGGGMRGIVTGAMLMGLLGCDARGCFDGVYGASAGAINATYFLTGA